MSVIECDVRRGDMMREVEEWRGNVRGKKRGGAEGRR